MRLHGAGSVVTVAIVGRMCNCNFLSIVEQDNVPVEPLDAWWSTDTYVSYLVRTSSGTRDAIALSAPSRSIDVPELVGQGLEQRKKMNRIAYVCVRISLSGLHGGQDWGPGNMGCCMDTDELLDRGPWANLHYMG
jgi:hypothetical protein